MNALTRCTRTAQHLVSRRSARTAALAIGSASVVLFLAAAPAAAADRATGTVVGHNSGGLAVVAAIAALLVSIVILNVVRVVFRLIAGALRAFMLLAALRLIIGLGAFVAVVLLIVGYLHP